jgi:phosphoketolase
MCKEPLEYLRHIQDECIFVLSVIGDETEKEELLANETLKRAIPELSVQIQEVINLEKSIQ